MACSVTLSEDISHDNMGLLGLRDIRDTSGRNSIYIVRAAILGQESEKSPPVLRYMWFKGIGYAGLNYGERRHHGILSMELTKVERRPFSKLLFMRDIGRTGAG
jgi:hypothetical protein